ncbi:MAG: efflux RND transporter permease subunit [Gemmatimonadales bacterium]
MIDRLIDFALRQRLLVCAAGIAVVIVGGWSYARLPVDAYPDISPVLVQIFTETEGLAPEEVEQLVTYPIEVTMNGLPGLEQIRSISNFGLSVVNVYFEEGTDIYFARQLVNERVQEAREQIPEGLGEPALGPISSGLGQILFYYLQADSARYSLEELRTIQDWIVKRNLQTVRGVTEVLSIGGHVRQYHVVVDPARLRQYGVSLHDVLEAVETNNVNVGASFLEVAREEYLVRSIGLAENVHDLENVTVVTRGGTPIRVADVATVGLGPEIRRGLVTRNGEGEVVVGFVLKLLGTNASTVIASVEERLETIRAALPEGVTLVPYYEQSLLVERATGTVTEALTEGLVIVAIVLALFLGDMRSSLIVAFSLPFSILLTFILMRQLGISANLMSLGGLAIGIGMMADASIVVVENAFRWLREDSEPDEPKARLVGRAAREVGRPIFFAITIITIVFLPLFTLRGVEGTMFRPLAYTIALAMIGSLLFSLTLAPVLASFLLKRGGGTAADAHHGGMRWMSAVESRYRVALAWSLGHAKLLVSAAVVILLLGVLAAPFLGREFIPTLNEGSLLVRATMAPSISLTESTATIQRVERALMGFPEVTQVVSRIGRGEIGAHSDPVNSSEIYVELRPPEEWTTARGREDLMLVMQERIGEMPGVQLNFTQPIAAAVDELLTGVRAQIAVKLFGPDLEVLLDKAGEIAGVIATVEGASEVQIDQVTGQPQLRVELDRQALARYGIPVDHVQEVIRAAIGGAPAGQVFEGERRWTIFVRYAEEARSRPDDVRALLIDGPDGGLVPLGQVARVETIVGPRQISREDNQRFITVQLNVRGRDIGSFVAEARRTIAEQVALPPGYLLTFGGQFELAQAANRRLAVVVPITILLIFGMLFASFGSWREALLIVLNLPLALAGGLLALLVTGLTVSVPASVGFIALFGIAVANGVVLITYFDQLRTQGMSIRDAVERGAALRLRPVLMTATGTSLGLVPLLLATGPGSEIQRPLAVVVIGGLVTSTALTLLVLPVLYRWMHGETVRA